MSIRAYCSCYASYIKRGILTKRKRTELVQQRTPSARLAGGFLRQFNLWPHARLTQTVTRRRETFWLTSQQTSGAGARRYWPITGNIYLGKLQLVAMAMYLEWRNSPRWLIEPDADDTCSTAGWLRHDVTDINSYIHLQAHQRLRPRANRSTNVRKIS